jgi:C4-dicarboxylate-binding protein DctP
MQSRVYEGILGFVSLMDAQKLYDVSPHYTQVGFGAMTILALHVNANTLAKLPPDVRAILIETARDFEARAAEHTRDLYEKRIGEIASRGAKVAGIAPDQKQKWAEALQPWTLEKAQEFDKAGLPGTALLKAYVDAAAELGHRWPVSYSFK